MRGINVGIYVVRKRRKESEFKLIPFEIPGTVQAEMFTSQWKYQSETQQKGEAGVWVTNRVWEITCATSGRVALRKEGGGSE